MDNFNKTDDLYDPNFSINSKSTEKLDMYGVWLKKKKDTVFLWRKVGEDGEK